MTKARDILSSSYLLMNLRVITKFYSQFEKIEFYHIIRQFNVEADELAKKGSNMGQGRLEMGNIVCLYPIP